MFKNFIFILLIGGAALVSSFFVADYFFSRERPKIPQISSGTPSNVVTTSSIVTSTESEPNPQEPAITTSTVNTADELPQKVLLTVPFTPQAPFGGWSDPRQQDGCEEASVVMAWRWANGEDLTRQEALEEITNMSNWEETQYGSYRDTSAADTLKRLLQEFYGYKGGRVEYDITLQDVKRELAAGNVLIIPFDGQILENPNFLNGGPERHMLVAIGYDDTKKHIITNDPGTRLGQGFTYSYRNFEDSFRDYETGDHEPIVGRRSAMIVVEKVHSQ